MKNLKTVEKDEFCSRKKQTPEEPEKSLKVRIVRHPPKGPVEPLPVKKEVPQAQPPAGEAPKKTFPVRRRPFRTTFVKEILPILIVIVCAVVVFTRLHPGERGTESTSVVTEEQAEKVTVVSKGLIQVGTSVEVVQSNIGPSGGIITVGESGGLLNGFQINVPANSYEDVRTFRISYAPVKSHALGENFNLISPLISVENGGGYSNEIMLVKIPVQIPEGHFAMAFFYDNYDNKSGQLEGVPLVTEDKNSVTIATRHFSNIIVSSIEEYRLKGVAKSGFLPGFDDWQFPNYGSYLEPRGHCTGQSLTAMWYYYEKFFKGKSALYGLYDNNGNEKTPKVWQDDTLAYRLASVVQNDIKWDSRLYKQMKDVSANWSAKEQVNAFAYSILATGLPQLVGLYDTRYGGGHAMIVYQVQNWNLAVADPNYPGVKGHMIKFDAERGKFEPYNSGTNTGDIKSGEGKEYDQILYISRSALIDSSQIASRWKEMEQATIGNDKFPDYSLLATEKDGTTREFIDGYTTQSDKLTIQATGNLLLGTSIYRDGAWLRTDATGEPIIDTSSVVILKPGNNKLGIWVCARMVNSDASAFWTWVDFQWVTVIYTPPTYGPLTGEWEGTFKIVTISKIAGEVFGKGEITGSISIAILQEESGVKTWVSTSDVQTQITFDNTAFGEYILVFSGWNEFGEITVNPDGSLKFTGVPYLELLTANVAGGVMSGSFERTSVSPLPDIIVLKRSGGKTETVIAPVETTQTVTIEVRKVSDEPPASLVLPTPKLIN